MPEQDLREIPVSAPEGSQRALSGPDLRLSFGLIVAAGLIAVMFYDALAFLVGEWIGKEEYSHGFMIPMVSAFFVWRHRAELRAAPARDAWWGIPVLLLGIAVFFLGELATLYIIEQYALLVVLAGLVITVKGRVGIRTLWPALVFLFFMIPLPDFLYNQVSGALQLISSEIGAAFIRACGIGVLLKGNVIDLGVYKLQVAEACSGLRYLFPLLSFGFICAYFYRAPLWERVLVFVSTIPITVLMNSFRIGVIGVLVENWGPGQAEGFLHYFEGWVIFLACLFLLFSEMWLLHRVFRPRLPFWSAFDFTIVGSQIKPAPQGLPSFGASFPVALAMLTAATIGASALSVRDELVPARSSFAGFPEQLGRWQGQRGALEEVYIQALKFSDYLFANYWLSDRKPVNLYIAYYESQRKGEAVHSPRSCIPGGGWQIQDIDAVTVAAGSASIAANRVKIQLGDERQLVYYWFHQRGRVLSNEYLVKWYLMWDAITRRRTDGALVRVMTQLGKDETWQQGDARLSEFLRSLDGQLESYLPS